MDIIDNYRDLPLGKYQEIQIINKDEKLDDFDRQVRIIGVLSGLSEKDVLALPIDKYKEMVAKSRFIEAPSTENHTILAKSYRVGDFDLIPVTDTRRVTTAQYIDFVQLQKAGIDEHIVEIMSTLLVPRGHKYCQDYDIADVQEAIRKDLSTADMLTLYAFFLVSLTASAKATLSSSKRLARGIKDKTKRRQVMEQIRTATRRNGDG